MSFPGVPWKARVQDCHQHGSQMVSSREDSWYLWKQSGSEWYRPRPGTPRKNDAGYGRPTLQHARSSAIQIPTDGSGLLWPLQLKPSAVGLEIEKTGPGQGRKPNWLACPLVLITSTRTSRSFFSNVIKNTNNTYSAACQEAV